MKQISTLNVAGEVIKAAETCVGRFLGGLSWASPAPTACEESANWFSLSLSLSLSPHVHMAQISVAEGPLRCDVMIFASLLYLWCPFQSHFKSTSIKGRMYFFVFIGLTFKDSQ